MKDPPKNVAASVRDRLLKLAKSNGEDFTYVLTRYALERLLVRLASSKHKDTFILKGAMLFRVWSPKVHRPTKDLDLLGLGAPDEARLALVFAEIASVSSRAVWHRAQTQCPAQHRGRGLQTPS